MAVEFIEGFDTCTAAQLARRYTMSGSQTSVVTGRNGVGQALTMSGFSQLNQLTIPVTSRSEYYMGFDLNCGSVVLGDYFIEIRHSSGSIGTIGANSDNAGTVTSSWGQSAAGIVNQNVWTNFQFHIIISPTSGVFQAKVDGELVISVSGINTGTNNITQFILHENLQTHTYDNMWILNTLGSHSNYWPDGYMTVQTLYPLTDGSNLQWTPNIGTVHYSMVDEVSTVDDDTTHVYDTDPGHLDSYGIQSLVGTIHKVHGVRASAVYRKNNANVEKVFRVFLKSGEIISESSDLSATTAYSSSGLLLNDDPNTETNWTTSSVNALEVGIKTQV